MQVPDVQVARILGERPAHATSLLAVRGTAGHLTSGRSVGHPDLTQELASVVGVITSLNNFKICRRRIGIEGVKGLRISTETTENEESRDDLCFKVSICKSIEGLSRLIAETGSVI